MADDKTLVRQLIKERSKQLTSVDNTLRAQIARLLSSVSPGPMPEIMSLDSVEVLLEPLLWVLFFSEEHVTPLSFRDRLEVPGNIVVALENAFRRHFGSTQGVTPWHIGNCSANLLSWAWHRFVIPASSLTPCTIFSRRTGSRSRRSVPRSQGWNGT